ncbi:AAA family ATPase [Pelagicoccus sp. SDUM812005]|uniref:AAA family ATPase n=1 Tax=Pelagicoccus sp. SDUM812005 TaxID=3041257 RepID=UPI00280C4B1F|nr:AAA family ATPase [Pelagicoccus sp. SDUM812005]MDQ8180189.1 AAA family ATPase [Pelagicoccus sp. SDUM812005]
MLRRIDSLRNFGIYRDFEGSDQSELPVFAKRNLIYGWNYSGKTTLSRLFQSLQFHDQPLPHPDGQFRLMLDDGTYLTDANRTPPTPVRVFNREYIESNFQTEHTAPAVFIVGREFLEQTAHLERILVAQEALNSRIRERRDGIDTINRQLNDAGTERARSISQLLGVRDFNRAHLQERVRTVRDAPSAYLLPEERIQALVETNRSGEQFNRIEPVSLSLPDLRVEIQQARELLRRTASFDAIESLRENRELEAWVREGLGIHDETNTCQFCGEEIQVERLEELRRHFSTASQELLLAINQGITRLKSIDFATPSIHERDFLQDLRNDASQKLSGLNAWLQDAAEIRQGLVAALENKTTALETPRTWDGDEGRFVEWTVHLDPLNDCIGRHNQRIQDMGAVRREARTSIEQHFAASHFVDARVAESEERIANLERRVGHANRAKDRLERIENRIEAQVNRTERGVEEFTQLVSFLLKDNEIRVEPIAQNRFQLLRGRVPASKLSDGEKTAIALAHFVTSLEGEGENLAGSIVYVDDPISSLDSNHIYAVSALIQERLEAAHQIFVSTHSSEFFSLLKARWLKDRELKDNSEGFYVVRSEDCEGSFSNLVKLPNLLRKFSSEYQFIFHQLHSFANNPSPTEFEAYAAPNLLRRFLEAYLGFRKPHIAAWHKKLDLILDSAESCREIHRLLDDASHLQRIGRALQEPAFIAITKARVNDVLLGLEEKDPEHYSSMVSTLS